MSKGAPEKALLSLLLSCLILRQTTRLGKSTNSARFSAAAMLFEGILGPAILKLAAFASKLFRRRSDAGSDATLCAMVRISILSDNFSERCRAANLTCIQEGINGYIFKFEPPPCAALVCHSMRF
jgi:hypothetical protein